jgi:hypothetical protein
VHRVSKLWQHKRAGAAINVLKPSGVHGANGVLAPYVWGQLPTAHAASRVSRLCTVKEAGG